MQFQPITHSNNHKTHTLPLSGHFRCMHGSANEFGFTRFDHVNYVIYWKAFNFNSDYHSFSMIALENAEIGSDQFQSVSNHCIF